MISHVSNGEKKPADWFWRCDNREGVQVDKLSVYSMVWWEILQ